MEEDQKVEGATGKPTPSCLPLQLNIFNGENDREYLHGVAVTNESFYRFLGEILHRDAI